MFGKILVANRGEIACRIMRTAHRMGIATVAVYSDADRHAPHVEMADEAVRIGPPEAAKSYLDIEAILEACRQTGAEAVHPGYGFLSERAAFPRALEAAGIVWVGPNAGAIEAMGDKIESKRRAAAAGVSTVPGGDGEVPSAEEAAAIARDIGYPVMIKASAGGGGKGMRIAHSEDEVKEGFDRARSEAASSFGDERVFVEKFIVDPRHIEIQVLGDKHGNAIHLLERECSIQRRNQKVIEEAPSPLLTENTRAAMGEQAVALARAVDYDSAGTVEFVADQDANFYFLEMNTRLQVEHPVTELVTGLDLVEEMFRAAAGERLRHAQGDIRPNGWAVEARLYAEDPVRGFLPSIGRLRRLRMPEPMCEGDVCIRVDTGVVEGSEISRFYDPMIAKVVTHGPDRLTAIDAMEDALHAVAIHGIKHNGPFLSALMAHPRWQEGRLSTGFIAEEYPDKVAAPLTDEIRRTMAAVAFSQEAEGAFNRRAFGAHPNPMPGALTALFDDGEAVQGTVTEGSGRTWTITLSGEVVPVMEDETSGDGVWSGRVGAGIVIMPVDRIPGGFEMMFRGATSLVRVMRPRIAELAGRLPKRAAADSGKTVVCPMPGLVRALHVKEGDVVEDGQPLAVIEAMKMENVIRAERAGTVKRVPVSEGDSLAVDAVILEFE